MKKVLGILIAVMLMASSFAGFSVSATEVLPGGFVVDGTVLVWYEGSGGDIVVPDGITEIGVRAFADNQTIMSVVIPHGVSIIEVMAFSNCQKMKSVIIPSSVDVIRYSAFNGCSSLVSVDIPNGVEVIENWAFEDCASLTSVTISKSVTSIESGVFMGCISLKKIDVSSDNEQYCSVDGIVFSKDKTILVQYPVGITDSEYDIPDGVKEIGGGAFGSCPSLVKVGVPDSVEKISWVAFWHCSSLRTINIPDSVTYIEIFAFFGCKELEFLYIPSSVEQISNGEHFGWLDEEHVFHKDTVLIVDKGGYAQEWAISNRNPYVLSSILSFDNVVDVYELLKLITYEVPLSEAQITAADVSGDSKVNCIDALAILKYVVNK